MNKILEKLEVQKENAGQLAGMYFAFFVSGMMSIILGALLPYLRSENALSYTQSGMMLSAHQIGNLGAVLLAGVLPYAIGRKRSTLILGSGIVLGMVLMTLTHSPLLLIGAFALTGISRGTMSNVCNVTISGISGNKTGALNVLHSIFAIGALLSPVLVQLCTGPLSATWKSAAWTMAALGLLSWLNLARIPIPDPPKKAAGASRSPLASPFFWLSTGMLFAYICAESTIIGWFVVYFEEAGILPSAVAKMTPAMLWFMIMLGRLTCASLSRRVEKNRLLMVLGIAFTLFFAGIMASKSFLPCVLSILGAGFSMAGIYPTVLATLKNSSSAIDTGLCISLAATGGILMPSIVGAVADYKGLTGGIATVLAALALMICLMAVNLRLSRREAAVRA